MPLKITVTYKEKEFAKTKGAAWDPIAKTWLVPDNNDINGFLEWIELEKTRFILKAPSYLAKTSRHCWKCKKEATLITLYSDNFYAFDDEYNEDEGKYNHLFRKIEAKSFFMYISYLSSEVLELLTKKYPFYKIAYSQTTEGTYWANHCEHCDTFQGDFITILRLEKLSFLLQKKSVKESN